MPPYHTKSNLARLTEAKGLYGSSMRHRLQTNRETYHSRHHGDPIKTPITETISTAWQYGTEGFKWALFIGALACDINASLAVQKDHYKRFISYIKISLALAVII